MTDTPITDEALRALIAKLRDGIAVRPMETADGSMPDFGGTAQLMTEAADALTELLELRAFKRSVEKAMDSEMAEIRALLDVSATDEADTRSYADLAMCLGLCGKLRAAFTLPEGTDAPELLPDQQAVWDVIEQRIDAAPKDGMSATGKVNDTVLYQQAAFIDGMRAARLAAINALSRSAQGGEGWRVGLLEWYDEDPTASELNAYPVFGHYWSRREGDRYELRLDYASGSDMFQTLIGAYGTIAALQAAAQADYEQRINSAIEPAPSTEHWALKHFGGEVAEVLPPGAYAAAPSLPAAEPMGTGIYIASKTKHAQRWRDLRASGVPINSTWIDEAGEGASQDLQDLWRRCIAEASGAAAIIVYREPGETLKGGWVELGAAAAHGVPVFAVGIEEFTIARHKGITHFAWFDAALAAALASLPERTP